MFNVTGKEEIIAMFEEGVQSNVDANLVDLDVVQYMDANDADTVRACVNKILANVTSAIPAGLSIPKTSMYVSPVGSEGKITLITITISNSRTESVKEFKYTCSITTDNTVNKLVNFFKGVYGDLLVSMMVAKNLEVVNGVLAKAVENAGVGYSVVIVPEIGANVGKKISYISDNEIHFVADATKVFELDDILALKEVSEDYTEEQIAEAIAQITNTIVEAQTTEQLVGVQGGALVSYVCNIKPRVAPATMIKKVVSRNAKTLTGNKDALAYYSDGDTFAIVAKKDGQFEVVLSPFDLKTLRKVDVDVIKALA